MSTSPTQVDPSGVDRVKWREMLARFSEGELKDLCFDLGIDYEDLPGQGKADKARELVAHCERPTEEGQHIILADPTKVEFTSVFTTDLPGRATYLVLFTLGIDEYAGGNADRALAYLGSALAAMPQQATVPTNPAETYYFRGNIYYGRNDYDRAIADYDQAIQHKPDYAEAYYNRGLAYKQKTRKTRPLPISKSTWN